MYVLAIFPPSCSHSCVVMSCVYCDCAGGRDVSPGLAAVVTIRFVPHSLDEYEDHLTLLQETGPLIIPLSARRERPCLVLSEGGGAIGEQGLDVGMTLIGDAKHTTYDPPHRTHL